MPSEIDLTNNAQSQDHSFHVGHVWDELMHDCGNTLRVAETLGHGGLNYAGNHKANIAEEIAGAAAVGFVAGAVLTAAPVLGTTAIVVGAAASIYEGFHLVSESVSAYKKAAPDLSIVWHADSHAKNEVARAEKNVEEKTGDVVSEIVVVPLCLAAGYGGARLGAAAVTGVQEALAGAGHASASDETVSSRSQTPRARAAHNLRSTPVTAEDAPVPLASRVALPEDDATTVAIPEEVRPNYYTREKVWEPRTRPEIKYTYHNPVTGVAENATYDQAVMGYFDSGINPEYPVTAKVFTGSDGSQYIQAGAGKSYEMKFGDLSHPLFHLGSTPVKIPSGVSQIIVDADGDTFPLWRAIDLSRFSK